jgi:hypothetical protein
LRHCATNRKVAVSITVVSLEYFIDIILPATLWHWGRQPQTGMYFLVGKGGRCVGLITLPPSCKDCEEIWEPQLLGTLRFCNGPVQGLQKWLSNLGSSCFFRICSRVLLLFPHTPSGTKPDQIFSCGMEPRSSLSCLVYGRPIIIGLKLRKRFYFSAARNMQDIYCFYQYTAVLRYC